MKKMRSIILISILLLTIIPAAHADSDWEFYFFGINSKDLKGRKIIPIFIGCISSFVVHEAGHLIAGNMAGIKTSMKWKNGPVAWADDYHDMNRNEKALFHGGGFLAQTLVGTALTAISYTRHSDFSVGFTGFTANNSLAYAITGGRDDSVSDVKNLDRQNYDGRMIAVGNGFLSEIYTYINLNKHK
ncbi:MAG: hypothetical protein V3S72_08290 [Desulfobacterales bacterium]